MTRGGVRHGQRHASHAKASNMMIVDAQIHLWAKGKPSAHHRQEPYSKDQALADMDAAGIDRAVIHLVMWDPESNELAVTIPRTANEFVAHWATVFNDPAIMPRVILIDNVVGGDISCFKMEGLDSVGYRVAKKFWGKGIATRALELLLQEVDIRPLHARVATTNGPSLRVLQKCGFKVVRTQLSPADERYPECEEAVLILLH